MKIERIEDWLQHRIDYWEDHIEEAGELAEEMEKGLLMAFYEVQEFIQGQRR